MVKLMNIDAFTHGFGFIRGLFTQDSQTMKWLHVIERVGPMVLAFTPLAPLAPLVVGAMQIAEQIPGATGAQKKALVTQLVDSAVQATNAAAGKTVIDLPAAGAVTSAAIDAVVSAVNVTHELHNLHPVAAPAA